MARMFFGGFPVDWRLLVPPDPGHPHQLNFPPNTNIWFWTQCLGVISDTVFSKEALNLTLAHSKP